MTRSRGRRSRREVESEINIVPLLDVLLVLLLIFMATSPATTQSVQVDLPNATDSKTVSRGDNPPVIIEVSGTGQYTIVIGRQRMEKLPKDQVIMELTSYLQVNPQTIFLIGGTKDVSYDEIIKALNILHRAGVKTVGLMTHPI